jgi:hypothetical protein
LKKKDNLDKEIEKIDLSKLVTYTEDYKKVQGNLEKFNDVIKNYVSKKND